MKRIIPTYILLFLSIPLLLACQSNNIYHDITKGNDKPIYLDEQFNKPSSFSIESEEDIFKLDDEMIHMVENTINKGKNAQSKAKKLLKQIFSDENISLSYSTHANLTARGTYHSQKANCMSLTIMAYALAKKANLNVNFQKVDVPEYWIRNGQYSLLTGHVNLLIDPNSDTRNHVVYGSDKIQIDFDPYAVKPSFPREIISKQTVLAMFYNNKGGQAVVNGNYDIAYQYFKAATISDHSFSPAWGNLAVLYRLTNHVEEAENTYRYAVSLNYDNYTSMTNLAILLRFQKKHKEAEAIENELLQIRINNPYYHAVLADEAYYNRNYVQALKHYKKALRLNNKIHEVYFGLAKVFYQMNRLPEAQKAMKRALSLNKTKVIEHQYIAKLNFLQAENIH